jgi:hypothetical protein
VRVIQKVLHPESFYQILCRWPKQISPAFYGRQSFTMNCLVTEIAKAIGSDPPGFIFKEAAGPASGSHG